MVTLISILNGPTFRRDTLRLEPGLAQQLDSLFAFYHRQWWCQRQMFSYYKQCNGFLNGLALLIMAAGMIVGPTLNNSMIATIITAVGVVVKGWNDFKKFFLENGHVSICSYHVLENVIGTSHACPRLADGRTHAFFGQDANLG